MEQKRFSNKDYELLRNTPRFERVKVKFLNIFIKVPDVASLLFLNNELFELEIYKFVTKNKKPVIIDCGANIGLSVIYFKKLYPDAKVIAFEPDKEIFEYLQFNMKSFGFKKVKLVNKALWHKKDTLEFFSEGADGGRISNSENKNNIIKIKAVRLSKYLKDIKVDFLKIDIEGAETVVLDECKQYLNNVANIYIEYHSFAASKQTLSHILSILEDSGFRYYVEHIGVKSKHPFMKIRENYGFDNQLHIFGYRK